MIEKMIPLEIPPGIVKDGTLFQRAGRWIDGNMVRFLPDGSVKPIGDATSFTVTAASPGGTPRAAFAWKAGLNQAYIACGTSTKLFAMYDPINATPTRDDITPGGGFTGFGTRTWAFDAMKDGTLLAIPGASAEFPANGTLYSWDLVAATCAVVAGAPACHAVVVTPENFLVVIQDDRHVQWASQNTTTSWTPSSTNSAGSLDLRTNGSGLAMRRAGGRTLIWTTQDLWALNYVGAPLYYGATQIAEGCGLYATNAVSVVENGVAYWMGEHGFWKFDGYLQHVPCPIQEDIFTSLDPTMRDRFFSMVMAPFNEIWWFYNTDSVSTGCNKVAIFNYVDGTWSCGTLARSAGTDSSIWLPKKAVSFDSAAVPYLHESTSQVMGGAYIESGPLMLDPAGNSLARVQKIVPDNQQTATTEDLTIYSGTWPKVAETSATYAIPAAGGEPIDVRISARYIRWKQVMERHNSRIGTPRLGVVKDSSR